MANIKQFIYAISRAPQSNYQDPVPPTSSPKNYDKVLRTNREPAELQPGVTDNADYTTGTAQATEREVSNFDIAPVFENERMNTEVLGRRAYAVFGQDEVEELVAPGDNNGVGVYKHIFSSPNIFDSPNLPAYTIVERFGQPALEQDEIHNKIIPSNTAESFTLSSGDSPYVQATTNWRGSGKRSSPANVNFVAAAVRQEEKITLSGAVTTGGNASAIVTIAGMTGSPKTISVPLFVGDSAEQAAVKTRAALKADAAFAAIATAFGSGANVHIRKKTGGANDATMNLEFAEGATDGLTAVATSTTVVAGAASAAHVRDETDFSFKNFKSASALLKVYPQSDFSGTVYANQCGFRSHTVTITNNLNAAEGYNGCPVFFEDGNPDSGNVRSELPSGGQSIDLSLVIRVSPAVAQNFNPENKLETQAYFSIELLYYASQIPGTVYTEQAAFKYPRLSVAANRLTSNNDIAEYAVSAPPLAFGNDSALTLEIISTIPDYSAVE